MTIKKGAPSAATARAAKSAICANCPGPTFMQEFVSDMRSLERRMGKLEASYKARDRYFGRLLAVFVGMPEQMEGISKRVDVLYLAVDKLLKQFQPGGNGIRDVPGAEAVAPAADGGGA